MTFHIEFSYGSAQRDKILRFLHEGGVDGGDAVRVVGAWIAVQTGMGFAIVETKNPQALYELCSAWTDHGQLRLTPIVPASDV